MTLQLNSKGHLYLFESSFWLIIIVLELHTILKLFGAILILYVPTELMVIGVIALRHRLRMKIENKVTSVAIEKTVEAISGEEITGENKEEVENYEARGTADKYDLTVGILGIVLSVVVVIAFIGILALGAAGII